MEFKDILSRAKGELDWELLKAIVPSKKHESYADYLNAESWLRRFWDEEVTRLKLHTSSPKCILDLGAGPGYFLYLCRLLGHKVIGIERPRAALEDFHDWLGIPVVAHEIGARKRLPTFPIRFDLVTSFRVPFNTKRDTGRTDERYLFDLDEWSFFLDDVRDNLLAPGGTFSMKMNSQPKHIGLRYGDEELMAYFASRGARDGEPKQYVTFAPLR
jgi:SAM-dependent methyltransferase